jgi:hypothetical protein
MQLPPLLPPGPNRASNDASTRAPLTAEDLKTDFGPRARSLEKLCAALSTDRYVALGLARP